MYYETAERHDTAVLDVLCAFLACQVFEFLEYVAEPGGVQPKKLGARRSAWVERESLGSVGRMGRMGRNPVPMRPTGAGKKKGLTEAKPLIFQRN
jgi:hypothetical protein